METLEPATQTCIVDTLMIVTWEVFDIDSNKTYDQPFLVKHDIDQDPYEVVTEHFSGTDCKIISIVPATIGVKHNALTDVRI